MRIIVDGDACPVKEIIVEIAKNNNIPVIMYFDDSHIYEDGYSEVYIVDQGRDSVDLVLTKEVTKNDLVITQDYGLASLILSKQALCINQNGLIYSKDNIDRLLFERFISSKNRKAGIKGINPKKRTKLNDDSFRNTLERLVKQ